MRTLDIIEYVVARRGGAIAQEIAGALAIPVSSLSYLLATLVERNYLRRDGRLYFAGTGLDRLRQPQEEVSFADRSRPLIKALRARLDETASLFLRDGWELVASVTETSAQALRYALEVGTRTPLHCVAAGKALLAELPPEDLDRYFAEARLERFTAHTICDREALIAELESARRAGFARACEEYSPGICAIGKAVRVKGLPIAAVSVAVPSARFDRPLEEAVIAEVLRTARELEDLAR
jgi:IclR family acetate operon transcriptional repressor